MNKPTWSIFFCASLLLFGCNSEKQTQSENLEQESTISNSTVRKQTHQIYFVTVDNLRVRNEAIKSSKVVDKLKENTLVYSTGEISDFQERVILRGREYNTPYRKISYDGKNGWIYGGGLQMIYNEKEPDSFTETLESLVTQLSNKEKSLLDRGKYILRVLQQERSGAAEWNDIMYILAEYHLNNLAEEKMLHQFLEKRAWTEDEYSDASQRNYNMLSNDFAKNFEAAGFKFSANEGLVEAIINPAKIKSMIEGPFSNALEEYIAISQIRADKSFFDDGGLSIPINDVVNYTILVEKFISNHPYFVKIETLQQDLKYLHTVIIHGTDNSPPYEFQSKKLNPAFSNAWHLYLQKLENGRIADKLKSKLSKVK